MWVGVVWGGVCVWVGEGEGRGEGGREGGREGSDMTMANVCFSTHPLACIEWVAGHLGVRLPASPPP